MKQTPFEPGLTYHVYNRGNNKENLFKEDKNYEYFLILLERYISPIADIYAYCLLKNHFHLLVRIKDKSELPKKFMHKPYLAFSHCFNAYTKSINKMYGRTGSLFQEHLKRKWVSDDLYRDELIDYIHKNPVKHGFCEDYKSYRYSSYRNFLK